MGAVVPHRDEPGVRHVSRYPVITAVANVLAHAPGLVRYGSKPLRDLADEPAALGRLSERLRSHSDAVAYPPNQVYVGNREPEALRALPRPWFAAADPTASTDGAFGDILDEVELYGLLRLSDR